MFLREELQYKQLNTVFFLSFPCIFHMLLLDQQGENIIIAELRAKAEAEDKVTAEQLGLNFDDITGRYKDFRLVVVGKLSSAELISP